MVLTGFKCVRHTCVKRATLTQSLPKEVKENDCVDEYIEFKVHDNELL